ncbi:Fic family protein [Alicyclobacillus sendaiensis]|uniref:Fic family protein n=1 Tax=Alicyclobacillus sendaiensis PA2 TaxID=3029425 RepID=A0ABT6Y126_ALISE|nr:Fic family protein [Alicyclobacillus sendaiensis]MDI9261041.1 Fic family protein [Alicyclobacillus sendaiensis PA2]
MNLTDVLYRIDVKKNILDTARPLPPASVKSLIEDFRIRYTHETTAIEGNTLTLRETQAVLEHGITIRGKPLREHLEVTNAYDTLKWLEQKVQSREPVSERLILELHRMLMNGILKEEAGFYRRVPVFIQGASHVPQNWRKVPHEMEKFEAWVKEAETNTHPVVLAAQAHIRLAQIHPFIDGNGRTCRLLVNYILMTHGYPPALYQVEKRAEYLKALEEADHGNEEPFIYVTAEATEWTLDRYLSISNHDR